MKPLKRHPALTQLSMEHHHTLALCLRIMREPEKNHRADITEHFVDLEHHFLEEETLFGPLWHKLPDAALRERFEAEHAQLRQMIPNGTRPSPPCCAAMLVLKSASCLKR